MLSDFHIYPGYWRHFYGRHLTKVQNRLRVCRHPIEMSNSETKKLLAALAANWQAEMEGFNTYTALAKEEADPHRRNALRGLAAAEKQHADLWAGRIREPEGPEPSYTGDLSGKADSLANRIGGADLAAKSRREIYEAEFAREREAVEDNEAEARELLSLSYQVRGLPEADAVQFVEHLAMDKNQLIRALARERLTTSEEGLSKPLVSAVSGALSTAVGAFIPIIPFFFMTGIPAVVVAAMVSLLAHFAVGAAKSLITIRSWWGSGFEMTWIGALERIVTYIIGMGLGRIGGVQ
jgi:VIT1/CCC1 family predicted Fe2+/Mn2+ transporter